jgi:hypothetical protein
MTEFFITLVGHWLMAQIPEPVSTFFAVVGTFVFTLTLLSLAWTTWKVHRILRKSLGREPRLGEDTSLTGWMRTSSESLDTVNRELVRNPFDRVRRFLI